MKLYVRLTLAAGLCLGCVENRCAADPKKQASEAYDAAEIAFLQAATDFVKADNQKALTTDLAKKFMAVGKTLIAYYTLEKDVALKDDINDQIDSLKTELNKDSFTNLRALKYFMAKNIIAIIEENGDANPYLEDQVLAFTDYLEKFKPEYKGLTTIFLNFGPTPDGRASVRKFDAAKTNQALLEKKGEQFQLPAEPKKLNDLILAYAKAFNNLKTDLTNVEYKKSLNNALFTLQTLFKTAAELTGLEWKDRAWNSALLKKVQKAFDEQKKALISDPEPKKTIKTKLADMQLAIAEKLASAAGKKIAQDAIDTIIAKYQKELAADLRKLIGAFPAKKTGADLTPSTGKTETISQTAIENFAGALKNLVDEKRGKLPLLRDILAAGERLRITMAKNADTKDAEEMLSRTLEAIKQNPEALATLKAYPKALSAAAEEVKSPKAEEPAIRSFERDLGNFFRLIAILDLINTRYPISDAATMEKLKKQLSIGEDLLAKARLSLDKKLITPENINVEKEKIADVLKTDAKKETDLASSTWYNKAWNKITSWFQWT